MSVTILALVVGLAVHTGSDPLPEPQLTASEPDSWKGKTREELLQQWGEPAKSRSGKDGTELLVFRKPVLVGYTRLGDPDSFSKSFGDGDDPPPPEPAVQPIYKELKFRFQLRDGRVERAEFAPQSRPDAEQKVYGDQPQAKPPS